MSAEKIGNNDYVKLLDRHHFISMVVTINRWSVTVAQVPTNIDGKHLRRNFLSVKRALRYIDRYS